MRPRCWDARVTEIEREIAARPGGWPQYSEDQARCMACAREWLTRWDELVKE